MDTSKITWALSAAILGAAAFVGYNMIYVPKRQQVAQIDLQLAEEQQTQQAQADVAKQIEEFETLRKRLPPEPDPSWFTQRVLSIASNAEISLSNISQIEPQTYQGFVHYSLQLAFTAPYHKLGTFVDLVERSDAFIRVERLSVMPPKEPGLPPQIDVVLGTVYAPPVIQAPAPAAAPVAEQPVL
jgi:Tfp pilus assembly protein PilO